jgi:hypothetical protein
MISVASTNALLIRKSIFGQKVTLHNDKKIPFTGNLKKSARASNWDVLELVTLQQIVLKSIFTYLPKVQNANKVLNRVVPWLKCMKLACWVLQASLNLYYYLR